MEIIQVRPFAAGTDQKAGNPGNTLWVNRWSSNRLRTRRAPFRARCVITPWISNGCTSTWYDSMGQHGVEP